MIKIEMKPTQYQIEIPGYGVFDVSPLGAGAEAEIRCRFRELDELMEKTKQYQNIVDKEKAGEEVDKDSEEYKECIGALQNASKGVDNLRDTIIEKMQSVIKGKNVDKLFNDFTYEQILEIHKTATKGNEE